MLCGDLVNTNQHPWQINTSVIQKNNIGKCPYQSFTGHNAGQVDDLQVSRLRDQRVRRQGDDVVAYPCQSLTLEERRERKRRREEGEKKRKSDKLSPKKIKNIEIGWVREGHFDPALQGGETEIVHQIVPHRRSTKSVSCQSLSAGTATRHCHRQNNKSHTHMRASAHSHTHTQMTFYSI